MRRPVAVLSALGLLTLAPIFATGLVCDDFVYAEAWRSGPFGLGHVLETGGGATRPIGTGLLMLLVGGLGAHGWLLGLIRIAHHVLNAYLVGVLVRTFWARDSKAPMVAAIAFLVWGSHAEVYWQASLHDVLACTFVLAAMVLASRAPSARVIVATGACALLGYWSKESAWCLPILLAACLLSQEKLQRRWWSVIVSSIVLLFALILRLLSGGLWGDAPAIRAEQSPDLLQRVGSLSKLVFRSVVPGWIDVQALKPIIKPVLGIGVLVFCVVIVGAVVSGRLRRLWADRSSHREIWAGLAFVAALVPVAGLSVSLKTSENARYLYLPTVFLVAAIALTFERARAHRPRAAGVALLLVLFFQAGSLHAMGWSWVRAAGLVETYRQALADLAASHPETRRWALLCAPDNYRGAFAARNTTAILMRLNPNAPEATILATRYVDEGSASSGCRFAVEGSALVVSTGDGQFAIANPQLHEGVGTITEGTWTLAPSQLRDERAREIRLTSDRLEATDGIAVFDGNRLVAVPWPPASSLR